MYIKILYIQLYSCHVTYNSFSLGPRVTKSWKLCQKGLMRSLRSLILNSHDPHSMLWWPDVAREPIWHRSADRHPANLHPVQVFYLLGKSRLVYFLQGRIISCIWSGSFQWVFSQ